MKTFNIVKIGFLLSFAITACKQTSSNKEENATAPLLNIKIDAYIKAHVENRRFNGNILVTKGDSIVYKNSFGLANREFNVPNSDSTIFLIGSITKPFTALAVLLLEKQKKLALEDKLSKYFPDFPKANQVSIKQLLTHTSGITDYHAFSNWTEDGKGSITPMLTLYKVASNPYRFTPGERFSYSNSGYILLGLIIEQVSGVTFEAFIQKEILNPLGMKNTGVISNDKIVRNLAAGYSSNPKETKKAEYINYLQPFTSGNMYSTPADLWKFTRAVVKSRLLDPEKTKEIFNVSEKYGYGWGIRDYGNIKAYGHHGAMNGFNGSITYIPDGECFICFLNNDDNTPKYTIAEDLVSIVKGKEYSLPKKTKLLELSDAMKQAARGKYLVKPGDTLHIFEDDSNLYLQETGQPKHELFPIDSLEYDFTLFEFHALFSKPVNGQSDSLMFTGKSNVKAVRIND